MLDLFRKIPHPKYGKCGGGERDCSAKPPIDCLDELFFAHDNDLFEAGKAASPAECQKLKDAADKKLAKGLRGLTREQLKSIGWKGRAYRCMAMMIFK